MSRILFVDEEPSVRRALRMLLEGEGYQVEEASGGRMALRSLEVEPPDLVMIEVHLHGMSGLETLRNMRRLGWNGPAILMTTIETPELAIEASKVGALVRGKPFDPEQILDEVGRALRRPGSSKGRV